MGALDAKSQIIPFRRIIRAADVFKICTFKGVVAEDYQKRMRLSVPVCEIISPVRRDFGEGVIEDSARGHLLRMRKSKTVFIEDFGCSAARLYGIWVDGFAVEMAPGDRIDFLDIFFVSDNGFVPDVLQESMRCFC